MCVARTSLSVENWRENLDLSVCVRDRFENSNWTPDREMHLVVWSLRLFSAEYGIGSLFTCCVTQSCVHDVNRPVIDYFNSASGCFVFDLCLFVHDLRIASVCAQCVCV
jgi:hypothetical protein